MKKIKTYPNHLEIITSFLIKILIQKMSQPLQSKKLRVCQYVKRMYDPTRDRDSGDNMITGLIKIL